MSAVHAVCDEKASYRVRDFARKYARPSKVDQSAQIFLARRTLCGRKLGVCSRLQGPQMMGTATPSGRCCCGSHYAAIRRHHLRAKRITRLFGHLGQLRAIVSNIGDFVGNDQVVFCVYCSLHVVANRAGSAAALRH